ncbi:MAG: Gfo/Idh/MocA family protein [Micrococcales bacterium]
MAEQIRWGILAPGGIAHLQASDMLAAGLHLQAVAARDLNRAQTFADQYQIPTAYGSYQELANDPSVDVIYIASTQNFHLEHALLCINAGKHVLLEKPFTLNAAQAKRVVQAARAKKVFAMEAMWSRFLPSMRAAVEVVRQGTIGDVTMLIADHNQYLPISVAPRLHDPMLGGGSIIDLGIYPVSFAFHLLGKPNQVTASGRLNPDGLDLHTGMIFGYESGQQALLASGIDSAGPVTAEILGTDGRIAMERSFYEQCAFTVYDSENNIVERYETKVQGRGMQYQAIEVETCIKAGKLESEIMPLSETVEIMETMDEIRAQIGVRFPNE